MEIIAEIGQNHNGDMGLAKELIETAKANGADVAKFQLYDAKKLFSRKNNPWFDYNCKTELSRNNVDRISRICEDVKIEFMASVFDIERIEWLEEVNVKRYKVASRSIFDDELITAIVDTKKPVLVSLGMWQEQAFPKLPGKKTKYLYCISNYPTSLEDIHLNKVDFNKYIGFSDHSIGISAGIAALVRGAKIIEKHFTLDKEMYGPDHECSMEPDELLILSNCRNDFKLCL